MKFDLADWYRSATIVSNLDTLKRRKRALTALIKKIEVSQIVQHVKISFELDKIEGDELAKLFAPFKKVDDTFSFDNTHEMEILSGCILAQLLTEHSNKKAADVAALAIETASLQGLRIPIHHEQLVKVTDEYISLMSLESPVSISQKSVNGVFWPVAGLNDKIRELTAENFNHVTIQELLREFNSNIDTVVKSQSATYSSAIENLNEQLGEKQEQVNMLWWLLAEWSNDLNKPFSRISKGSAAILAGKELADLSMRTLGPPSVSAIIHRILELGKGGNTKAISIPDSVNDCPRSWRDNTAKQYNLQSVGKLCPISIGIAKSLETNEPDNWTPVFEKASGLESSLKLKPLNLGFQFYRERLLLKLI